MIGDDVSFRFVYLELIHSDMKWSMYRILYDENKFMRLDIREY